MFTTNKEEVLTTINNLLDKLVEDEQQAAVPPFPDVIEMLTVKECCETVKGLTEYTVRQLVSRGEIPFVRCGKGKRGKILVPKAALLNYFNGAGR